MDINPLESAILDDVERNKLFDHILNNAYRFLEVLKGKVLTQEEKDVVFKLVMKNANLEQSSQIRELYKGLLQTKPKGKDEIKLIEILETFIFN